MHRFGSQQKQALSCFPPRFLGLVFQVKSLYCACTTIALDSLAVHPLSFFSSLVFL